MVPNTPPPPSDKEKEAHENAGGAGEGDPKLLLNILNDGWISVKERLPEPHTDVICHSQFGAIGTGYLITTSEWSGWEMRQIGSCDITHWMPLPNPPKNP